MNWFETQHYVKSRDKNMAGNFTHYSQTLNLKNNVLFMGTNENAFGFVVSTRRVVW